MTNDNNPIDNHEEMSAKEVRRRRGPRRDGKGSNARANEEALANQDIIAVDEAAEKAGGAKLIGNRRIIPFMKIEIPMMVISALLIIASVVAITVKGLNLGLDFTGGVSADVSYAQPVEQAEVTTALANQGFNDAVVQYLGTLFIENKQRVSYETDPQTGKTTEVRTPYSESRVINRATINAVLGSSFVITGLDSAAEADELALLLRSGALAAPMYFVEERTIGPSLGQDNIDKGLFASKIGYLLVFLWMIVFYRACGVIASIALATNIIMLAAIMSIIGSSLTLPGIAGIVLTMGMAVDANVLIFERIREELDAGARAKSAIVAGFDRAFSSIFDGNITTLLVAFILFAIGTGPVKGFAITLAIGIITSLFTAIIVTRALMQIWYGYRKNLTKISIG